ncbi:MAG: metallophosphoesterase [Candidatus Heimdallarchaeota archaeon]|nr:MAG: metallophosphoesterase [Candidatus Heimdallarchaeota archaeon]
MAHENSIDRRYLLRKFNNTKVLLVADLHLGFEAEWANRGLKSSKPEWSFEIIDQLKKDIEETLTDQLIILGDLEHSFIHFRSLKRKENGPWVSHKWLREKALTYFMEQIISIEGLEISLIRGNQDTSIIKSLQDKIKIYPEKEASLFNQLGVFHGHMKPGKNVLFSSEIMLGHVHPTIEIIDELQLRHRYPVFAKLIVSREEVLKIFNHQLENEITGLNNKISLTILPAYNRFLSGFVLNQISRKEGSQPFSILRSVIQHPKLKILLTNGVDLGLLEDL